MVLAIIIVFVVSHKVSYQDLNEWITKKQTTVPAPLFLHANAQVSCSSRWQMLSVFADLLWSTKHTLLATLIYFGQSFIFKGMLIIETVVTFTFILDVPDKLSYWGKCCHWISSTKLLQDEIRQHQQWACISKLLKFPVLSNLMHKLIYFYCREIYHDCKTSKK